jgi:hypothetical protein
MSAKREQQQRYILPAENNFPVTSRFALVASEAPCAPVTNACPMRLHSFHPTLIDQAHLPVSSAKDRQECRSHSCRQCSRFVGQVIDQSGVRPANPASTSCHHSMLSPSPSCQQSRTTRPSRSEGKSTRPRPKSLSCTPRVSKSLTREVS